STAASAVASLDRSLNASNTAFSVNNSFISTALLNPHQGKRRQGADKFAHGTVRASRFAPRASRSFAAAVLALQADTKSVVQRPIANVNFSSAARRTPRRAASRVLSIT